MKCPKCGSDNTQFVTNTIHNGPSVSQGCCGWIVLGPVGLLCSFCGMGSDTEEYWMCHSCGSKFQAGQYEKELKKKEHRVSYLRKDIVALEKSIENKPDDLEEKILCAKEQYDIANENYNKVDKEFVNSSGVLKFVNVLNILISILAVIVFLFGAFLFFAGTSAGDFGLALILAIVCGVITIALFSVASWIMKKAKKSVDKERAEELDRIWQDVQSKKKVYDDLQKIKNDIQSREQKINELAMAEKELVAYRGENKK